MTFKILRDHINDGESNGAHTSSWRDGVKGYEFKLFDDDGVLYFDGVSTVHDDERAFAPLDDFGSAFGCTSIKYRSMGIKGSFQTL